MYSKVWCTNSVCISVRMQPLFLPFLRTLTSCFRCFLVTFIPQSKRTHPKIEECFWDGVSLEPRAILLNFFPNQYPARSCAKLTHGEMHRDVLRIRWPSFKGAENIEFMFPGWGGKKGAFLSGFVLVAMTTATVYPRMLRTSLWWVSRWALIWQTLRRCIFSTSWINKKMVLWLSEYCFRSIRSG